MVGHKIDKKAIGRLSINKTSLIQDFLIPNQPRDFEALDEVQGCLLHYRKK